jgi:hypothetical protein
MNAEVKTVGNDILVGAELTAYCGIVMPIASMGDYSESHWSDVYSIIKEAVASTGFKARLVSESAEATVIIRSIVQNLYDDEIVVCDVSGMNPNVMFELGMRLAFDKPVVIIKDDATRFSFDINTIEHLEYPKSLRYQTIQEFKSKLSEKIKGTLKSSKDLDSYRSFLSNFGSFTVANLKDTTLNESEALEKILNKLNKFDTRLIDIERSTKSQFLSSNNNDVDEYKTDLFTVVSERGISSTKLKRFTDDLKSSLGDLIKVHVEINGNMVRKVEVFTFKSGIKAELLAEQVEEVWDNLNHLE